MEPARPTRAPILRDRGTMAPHAKTATVALLTLSATLPLRSTALGAQGYEPIELASGLGAIRAARLRFTAPAGAQPTRAHRLPREKVRRRTGATFRQRLVVDARTGRIRVTDDEQICIWILI